VTKGSFEVLRGAGPRRAAVAHIPHASTHIPPEHRAGMLLDDAALRTELTRLTDWHTDALYGWLADEGVPVLVNRISRLVVDPVRFLDDDLEPMAALGQGVVYERTTDGSRLRVLHPELRAAYVRAYYEPYHAALSGLVDAVLAARDHCLILDCHSFGSVPLPSEPDQDPDRPDICVGTDPFHTPEELATRLEAAFAREGFRVRRDAPFRGALVPQAHYRRDPRVSSVMIEVRRGLYCDEATGAPLPSFDATREAVTRAITSVLD
jgi:N-formylglutamate deformylase